MLWNNQIFYLFIFVLLFGCVTKNPAPIADRLPPVIASPALNKSKGAMVSTNAIANNKSPANPENNIQKIQSKITVTPDQKRPEFYTVRSGDTLFAIALEFGLDYRDLANWNGIDPSRIIVGQQLMLRPKSYDDGTSNSGSIKKSEEQLSNLSSSAEPKGIRVIYNDKTFAQMYGSKDLSASNKLRSPADSRGDSGKVTDEIIWSWPTLGKVVTSFNDSLNKGLGISGEIGGTVYAAAIGKVIFRGTGIRGLGQLIVIKHSEEFLSVYAHNKELYVKEGQSVSRGQKIAQIGGELSTAKLHFEIRRYGKPVDPIKLLPADQ